MDKYAENYTGKYSKIVKFYILHAAVKMSEGLSGATYYILFVWMPVYLSRYTHILYSF